MAETFYRTGNYNVDHSTFGGIIYPSDYDPNFTNGNIASRIENDKKFDDRCRKNLLNRQTLWRNKNA